MVLLPTLPYPSLLVQDITGNIFYLCIPLLSLGRSFSWSLRCAYESLHLLPTAICMCTHLVHDCLLSTYYMPDTIPAVEIQKYDVVSALTVFGV